MSSATARALGRLRSRSTVSGACGLPRPAMSARPRYRPRQPCLRGHHERAAQQSNADEFDRFHRRLPVSAVSPPEERDLDVGLRPVGGRVGRDGRGRRHSRLRDFWQRWSTPGREWARSVDRPADPGGQPRPGRRCGLDRLSRRPPAQRRRRRPVPSRIVSFVLQATSDGPATYVSPNLGFAVPLRPPRSSVQGYWSEGGRLADAGGILTFPAGTREAGGSYSHAIRLPWGPRWYPAPVNLVARPSTSGAPAPRSACGRTGLTALIQVYATRTGASGRQRGDAPGWQNGAAPTLARQAAVAVAVLAHDGRVYIVSTRGTHRTIPRRRPSFRRSSRASRFVDAGRGRGPGTNGRSSDAQRICRAKLRP